MLDLNLCDKHREKVGLRQEGTINNIRTINLDILLVLEEILKQSPTEPIIINQSVHGSDFFDRTMIISAF